MKVVTLKALKIFAIVMTILFVASMSFSIAYVAVDKTNNESLTSGIVTERTVRAVTPTNLIKRWRHDGTVADGER